MISGTGKKHETDITEFCQSDCSFFTESYIACVKFTVSE